MKFSHLLSKGIEIYALMFLLWSGFTLYGFYEGFVPRLVGLAVLVMLALFAGKSLRLQSWHDILPYSLFWTLEVAVLDILYSVPFTGWQLFSDWNVWVGYALIVIIPLAAPRVFGQRHATTA